MMLKVFEMGFYVFMWVGKHLGINFDFFWWTWDSYQSWDLCFVLSWGSFWHHRLDDLVNLQNSISWPILSLPKFASKKKKKRLLRCIKIQFWTLAPNPPVVVIKSLNKAHIVHGRKECPSVSLWVAAVNAVPQNE